MKPGSKPTRLSSVGVFEYAPFNPPSWLTERAKEQARQWYDAILKTGLLNPLDLVFLYEAAFLYEAVARVREEVLATEYRDDELLKRYTRLLSDLQRVAGQIGLGLKNRRYSRETPQPPELHIVDGEEL